MSCGGLDATTDSIYGAVRNTFARVSPQFSVVAVSALSPRQRGALARGEGAEGKLYNTKPALTAKCGGKAKKKGKGDKKH